MRPRGDYSKPVHIFPMKELDEPAYNVRPGTIRDYSRVLRTDPTGPASGIRNICGLFQEARHDPYRGVDYTCSLSYDSDFRGGTRGSSAARNDSDQVEY